MKRATVIALHGIGEQRAGWSGALEEGVRKKTETFIRWVEVGYADINAESAEAEWKAIEGRVGAKEVRKFVFTHVTDALLLDTYEGLVFSRIERELAEVREGERVILVAHSLGTVLASRWVRSGKRIDALVTLGSPIPIFPDPPFNKEVGIEWTNFYDRRDPIGHPLEPFLGATKVRDVETGNLWSWLPGYGLLQAHINYDRNKKVHAEIARMIDGD